MVTVCAQFGYFAVLDEVNFVCYPVIDGVLGLFRVEGSPGGMVSMLEEGAVGFEVVIVQYNFCVFAFAVSFV